ncbi:MULTISPECIES: acetyl-CoA carboxylase biotin carboxylase subunit [Thermomonospora]|uniref:biotin carboxylase n=1 Tax=Thermomonospora curvata (strain ATCC 19995 / DSM 43183 / JCM 3096 / KCTC 9072 / NBRC 15933 / NCIMB 10081 / Henssen B9) TaxID=471852 RepID=D1ACH7_THECD|nr:MULTISPECIES: biotin carboxylase N-terminal domain-containing protein [Thermomonospora]ACY99236.1 Carbamoyl-phosphate synthase L chain ATP- binding protein [Thermomonospora curvata DSM 43183]PKK12300.1 MAG: biotin carboxylase [Thermomonospora sp. CIF 1]
MFESVLVANRGEIASRVIHTVRAMGLKAIAVYSEADADLPFVAEADEAILIGPAHPAGSYLDADRVLEAARRTNAQAIHPGYGFLAESAEFAERVTDQGLVWIGPPPLAIARMGDKINARNLMIEAGVPVAAGVWEPVPDAATALAEAERIGYPVMVKAAGGGGGIGMGAARDEAELVKVYASARSSAERFFRNPDILLERYVERARHVEVQILGLADGTVVALGERDCSVQRRHQKIVEETPSPGVDAALRARMTQAAVRAGEAVGYRGAGTVEFLLDVDSGEFVFLEMNTRLQVEHPITELVTGIDLVEQQLLIAAGEQVTFTSTEARGHAVEFRVCAEDPLRFLPSPGDIKIWQEPVGEGIRIDAGYAEGNTVTPFYDSLLAKLCVHAADRPSALRRAAQAVGAFQIEGPKTNLPFFIELLGEEEFVAGTYDTGLVARMRR